MRAIVRLVLITSLTFAAACSSEVPEKASTSLESKPGKKVDAATAGVLTGKIAFDGDVPPPRTIDMNADKNCVTNAGPNPQSGRLLVGQDRGVRNVFVHVKAGLDEAFTFDAPSGPALLDQKGCIYTPRVLGVRVGQAIEVVNSDATMHNVHALPMANAEFNLPQPKQFMRLSRVFTVPEVMVRFKCDVHSWMSAWVGVVSHPYFAVTGDKGEFEIKNLPPGTYTIEAWHESLGTRSSQVTVGPSQTQSVAFTFTTPAK